MIKIIIRLIKVKIKSKKIIKMVKNKNKIKIKVLCYHSWVEVIKINTVKNL